MSHKADTQQSLIVGLSYIIAKQAAQIEALEKRAAPAAPAGDGSAAVAAFDEPTQTWTAAAPASQRAPVDPTVEMSSRLASVNTLEELQVILHPPDLFTGYSNKEEIYTTVKRRLTEIAESSTTYLQLAAEEDSMSCVGIMYAAASAANLSAAASAANLFT